MRVYDKYLNLLVETTSYQSLQYTRNYHGVGSFEIHINRYAHGAEHFDKGNLISLGQKHKVGIIVTREIELNESGKESENLKLTGTTLCGLLDRRITVPPTSTSHDRKQGNAETVMKHYVQNHFVNPDDSNRRMKRLEIAPNRNRGEHVKWESRYKNIGEELEKISKESNLGWEIHADFKNKKFIFDVVERKDLTQRNTDGNNPVFFSPEFETVKSQSFMDSDNDLRNFGYVGGQGEGKERKIVEIGQTKGFDRIETFVDARDVSNEDEDRNELPEDEVVELLTDRGTKKMKEMETLLSFETEILTPITRKSYEYTHEGYRHPGQPVHKTHVTKQQITPFEYEVDFDLGDVVDVVNKSWNLTMSTPIVEITEIHEASGFRLEAVFGEKRPTLISKLNRKFDDVDDKNKYEASVRESVKESNEYTDEKIEEGKPSTDKLWEGALRMTGSQHVKPSKKITDCKTGWVLQWQRYSSGVGAVDNNFQFVHVPKTYVKYHSGKGVRYSSFSSGANNPFTKYFYIYPDKIEGRDQNLDDENARITLTAIYEY